MTEFSPRGVREEVEEEEGTATVDAAVVEAVGASLVQW